MSTYKFEKELVYGWHKAYTNKEKSLRQLALENNIDYRVITRNFFLLNLPFKKSFCVKKRSIDEYFFEKIDNNEKAYILGLLYADGNICNNSIKIKLHRKDRYILEEISKLIFKGEVVLYEYNNEGEVTTLKISNIKMYKDLKLLGLQENKTYKKSFLPAIDNKYYPNFIKGFFDGDGTCGVYFIGKNQISRLATFINADYFLLTLINDYIKKSIGVEGKISQKKYAESIIKGKKLIPKIPCYGLTFSGKETLTLLYNWLYIKNRNNLFLWRKKINLQNCTLTPSELEDLKVL